MSAAALSGAPARIARVALDLPRLAPFDYLAGDATEDDLGRIAIVPFGNRKLAGLIVGFAPTSPIPTAKLRPIAWVQRDWPAVREAELAAFRFCAEYYHHALGAVAMNAMPPRLRAARPFAAPQPRRYALSAQGRAWLAHPPARAKALTALLASVAAGLDDEASLRARHARAAAGLDRLLAQGALVPAAPLAEAVRARITLADAHDLNADQRSAVAAICGALGRFAPFLLDGVTGSGKTEVYLHAIAAALGAVDGGQALVLMPEINLTPQFLHHLSSRLPAARIVALHSGLPAGERVARHLEVAEGRADVVIGTRLAVFAPLARLRLIVVDEEHDASFKQQEGLRYSARDIALFRARHARCPVVLGSATPSLETLANTARGRYTELRLNSRAHQGASLPSVEFIDLNAERPADGLTQTLREAIGETLARGEQALIFLNRRGFAPVLMCTQCGHLSGCPRCSARLTFHRRERSLRCHHCGHRDGVPEACPQCGSIVVVAVGEGTERIEGALARAFPAARIARIDRDAVRGKGEMERVLGAAREGALDLLIGTQMLAKGHDFARLTLVGVVNADGAMFSANFRATERLVAMLIQVAGRAGRAERPGRVLIQTAFADHPFYRAIARHDYRAFATMALAERRSANLPPYAYLALLRAESESAEVLERFMKAAASAAQRARSAAAAQAVEVWDAVAPTLARKAGFERAQLMVQSQSRTALHAFLTAWLADVERLAASRLKWIVDVDPIDI
jgi:primosomal protein N' (replication factor Y)